MKIQTTNFVDRNSVLAHFERQLRGLAPAALAIEATNGYGKTFLLREMALQCQTIGVKGMRLETSAELVPDHWRIAGRIVEKWPEAMTGTAAVLEARNRSEQADSSGRVTINARGNIVIYGDVVGRDKVISRSRTPIESDAHTIEKQGWDTQLEAKFFRELAELHRSDVVPSKMQPNPFGPLVVLLFDNVDLATQETSDWLVKILRRMWDGDLPRLRLILACQVLPKRLETAAGDCLEKLTLEPFSEEDVQQYLSLFDLPPELALTAYGWSGGEPLLLNSMVMKRLKQTVIGDPYGHS
jgi:hypothetical protein